MAISLNAINNYFVGSSGCTFAGVVKAPDIYITSDKRAKENIIKIDNALEKLNKLNGYTFNYISSGESSGGVIAQELLDIMPGLVKFNSDTNYYSVQYNGLIALLIESVKELTKQSGGGF